MSGVLVDQHTWDTLVQEFRNSLMLLSEVRYTRAPDSGDVVLIITVYLRFSGSTENLMKHLNLVRFKDDGSRVKMENYWLYLNGAI